jgi:tetratricopeptide (TPR) repeat protein
LLAALLWLVCWTEALAQTEQASPPPQADECTADPECAQHYQQARSLSKAGQLADALKEYAAAYALRPMPTLLFNMARLNHRLGRNPEAISGYRSFLSQETGTDPALRDKAKDYLAQLEKPPEPPRPTTPTLQPALTAEAPQKDAARVPIYKKWWLWTSLGVLVAGGAAAVIIGTQVDPRSRPSELIDLRGQL